MEDICNFIPRNNYKSDLQFLHFVYETNVRKFSQPFSHSNYYVNIVFKGSAVLKFEDKEIHLESGDVFFTFPYQRFYIDADEKFTFLYISFNGDAASSLLDRLNINAENCVYKNFEHLLKFWMDSIRRINNINAYILTESVFMYTLSYIDNSDKATNAHTKDKFEIILDYIRHNFTTPDMSIKKVADIFFYNEKYLSSLFVKNSGMKFTQHLNNLRISYAKRLISEGNTNISEISSKSGYSDSFYFSKVFKKLSGETPTQYIKKTNKD